MLIYNALQRKTNQVLFRKPPNDLAIFAKCNPSQKIYLEFCEKIKITKSNQKLVLLLLLLLQLKDNLISMRRVYHFNSRQILHNNSLWNFLKLLICKIEVLAKTLFLFPKRVLVVWCTKCSSKLIKKLSYSVFNPFICFPESFLFCISW